MTGAGREEAVAQGEPGGGSPGAVRSGGGVGTRRWAPPQLRARRRPAPVPLPPVPRGPPAAGVLLVLDSMPPSGPPLPTHPTAQCLSLSRLSPVILQGRCVFA